MSFTTVLLVLVMTFLVVAILESFLIFRGVGFRNAYVLFTARFRAMRGYGLVKLINQTGIPEIIPYKFDGKELIEPLGKGKGRYIFKSHCLMLNEYSIPMITYRKGDTDPIDPKTGLQTITSSSMLEELIARTIKAESSMKDSLDWLKKNWKPLGLGIVIVIGAMIFLYMHMADAIVEAGKHGSQTIILNASSIGK